jgi:hypothetical protein
MSEKYKDNGEVKSIGSVFAPLIMGPLATSLGETRSVTDTETGETRNIHVDNGQDLGTAIANGQWED